MTRSLLALLVLAGACVDRTDSGPRVQSTEDGVSFARLPGWDLTRERGTLLLHRTGRPATIAIRTALRASWSEPRTRDNVVPAVATALRALPGAHVRGPTPIDSAEYAAVAFDVDFAPPGRGRFQRRHVTLIGDTHIIHVFLVAPAGRADESRRELETIVNTLREEG